jgi:hypothetical protein
VSPSCSGRSTIAAGGTSDEQAVELFFGLRLSDAEKIRQRKRATSVAEEHLRELLQRLEQAETSMEVSDILFSRPPENLLSSEGIRNYVKEQLTLISRDTRSHRDVCADLSFDLQKCLPRPWMLALQAYAEANGLHTEALAWCLYANLSFLEHPSRRIGHSDTGRHTEAVNMPVLIGGAVSSRKSFLISSTTKMMTECEDAPVNGFRDRGCIMADATLAGLRTCIYNHNRAAVTSDEASNVYDTPWKDASSGLHYLQRSKINNYVLSEADDGQAGRAGIRLGFGEHRYLFHHKALGHLAKVMKLLPCLPMHISETVVITKM